MGYSGDSRLLGASGSSTTRGLVGASYGVDIWIGRIERGTVTSVKKHLTNKRVYPLSVIKTSHDNAQFHSFRIKINNKNVNTVLKASFWPDGMAVRRWKEKVGSRY